MKKNVASQAISCQMISATDGSEFTGSVTVSVTGDNGTQATGSVGSGACTHEGHGLHSYAPAQAETNYDYVVFTFYGTGAITSSVHVYTSFPQTGDNFARLGAPAGASMAADIAAVKTQTAAIETDTQDIQSRLPAALGANGNLKADVRDYNGTAGTFSGGRPEVNMTHIAGTAWASTTLFTLASHDPGATLGTSTLTQAQVTGGAYALNSASFAFNAALDLTTTQKASVNTEADTALADVGLTTTITGRIDAAVSTRLASASYTSPPSAASNASAVFTTAVDGSTTFAESVRLANATLGGKASGLDTTSATYRDLADTKNRVTATVDADGNRTAVTLDLT